MFRSLKSLLIAAAVVAGTTTLTLPQSSVAHGRDRYWNNHWNWYDRSYRPYYYGHRGYYGQHPGYGYGRGYYGQPYQAYRYGYGYPGYYYGNSVRLGPLQFNWR